MERKLTVEMEDMDILVSLAEFFTLSSEGKGMLHEHPDYEILYVPYGTMEYTAGDKTYCLTGDSVLLIPPGVLHEQTDVLSDVLRFSCSFSITKNDRLTTGLYKKCTNMLSNSLQEPLLLNLHIEELSQLRGSLLGIYKIQSSLPDFTDTLIKAYITVILAKVMFEILKSGNYSGQEGKKTGGEASPKAMEIQRYITTNYNRNPSVKELSEALHLSLRQTERIIEKQMKSSFSALLNSHRIKLAQHKIFRVVSRGENMAFSKIAESVGFSNYYTFLKQFKIYTGISPGEYKRKCISGEITGE